MSHIPVLKLPSSGRPIKFREATVDDCLRYCDLNEDFDELMTTEYLNSVQVGEVDDSANWTADDRMVALWWIFITTSKDTTLAYQFHCAHCGDEHLQLVDFVDLDDEATSLRVKPYIDDQIAFNGEVKAVRLHPYTGMAMMDMEQAKIDIQSLTPDTSEHKRALAHLKILEVAHGFDFKDSPTQSFESALNEKLDAISKMSRVNEFPELAAAVKAALGKLEHGLHTQVVDGKIAIVSPPMLCESQKDSKGEAMQSRLLIPFLGAAFIPAI